jgi:hypothetical protein
MTLAICGGFVMLYWHPEYLYIKDIITMIFCEPNNGSGTIPLMQKYTYIYQSSPPPISLAICGGFYYF